MAIDVEALYPTIAGILKRSGAAVRLGGVVTEDQTFGSEEETTYAWEYGSKRPPLRRLYERAKGA